MRALLTLVCAALAIGLAGCGGDSEEKSAGTTQTAPATTQTTTATTPTSSASDGAPKFPPNKAFSGDELMTCAKAKGLNAEREEEPAKDDKVGAGIVHDRILLGATAGKPAARVFMFAGDDPAREQAPLVTKRSPDAEHTGTVIFEPLTPEASKVRSVVFDCFDQQLSG